MKLYYNDKTTEKLIGDYKDLLTAAQAINYETKGQYMAEDLKVVPEQNYIRFTDKNNNALNYILK